ncbi:MAG: lipoyl(octanoyl) transferase LipB [Crocinitomicaceae bacterium]|nr:lipoyl(octanoyl) transferase LipB [Crocinitomicaceae bacterium]
MKPKVYCHYLDKIDYKKGCEYQEVLFNEAISRKKTRRTEGSGPLPENHLIFCEHPHVYTLGKSGDRENLLIDNDALKEKEAVFYKTNRGGDITYHGPGQLVVYPIFDLEQFFTDIHKYMRFLEESVIKTLEVYNIKGERSQGLTGVWIQPQEPHARKICAMGVKSSRWVTMHGIGFNIHPNLSYFENIIPCGITDKNVTSLSQELDKEITTKEVIPVFLENMAEQFNFKPITFNK